jgi:hypothetical protein
VLTVAVVESLPVVADGEPAASAAPVATGGPVSAGDDSSSRDRLVRIATLIRDGEEGVPVPVRRRARSSRPFPQPSRRSPAGARTSRVADSP